MTNAVRAIDAGHAKTILCLAADNYDVAGHYRLMDFFNKALNRVERVELNVPGAPTDSQTVPAKFSKRNDAIDRVPQLGPKAAYAKQAVRDKLIEHRQFISNYGEDMPEIRNWSWPGSTSTASRDCST